MEQRVSSLSVNLSQGRCKVLPPSVHLQTLSLLCPHKTIKKAAFFENKFGDEKGKVITLSVNKNCQNLRHSTVQYVWIQTILLPTEHRASPFTGICVKLGETQSSSLDLWSLMKGAATYSSHSYCVVSWHWGASTPRAKQLSEVGEGSWGNTVVKERWRDTWITGIVSEDWLQQIKIHMEVRDLDTDSL